jgi:Ca-activated chloride channel homolog
MSARHTLTIAVSALFSAIAAAQAMPTFSTDVRMVEVYATVADSRGRYIDGLQRDQFTIRDNGEPQPITLFETASTDIVCAILMDTTGSMARDLPVLKSAVVHLIDDLPPSSRIAVYAFSHALEEIQDFTADKKSAKQKVLRVRAGGETALFDAIVQTARRLASQNGKKFLVVFTDGDDNASVLNAQAAITRSKQVGVPVYAVALGAAVRSRALYKQLHDIATETGGLAYEVKKKSSEVEKVFSDISAEIQHTYLIAYKAPPPKGKDWRHIDVAVSGVKSASVRAKQGYLP